MNFTDASLKLIHDAGYPLLRRHIIESTGLVYYMNKDADLAERVQKRLSALGMHDCTTYLALLADDDKGGTELDALIIELTIGETYFFRHLEQFDALRDEVIPSLIRKNAEFKKLRIWSAGCSIGAEPYSLAILLERDFSHLLHGWDVNILGTDINREFLIRAKEGKFDEWAFRGTEESLRRDYFTRKGNAWEIAPRIKKNVCFQYHNLLKHPFPSLINNLAALDLIICRNVMIYFDREKFTKVVSHFEDSLVEGGWLLLGHAEQTSESLGSLKLTQFHSSTFYKKNSGEVQEPFPAFSPGPPLSFSRTETFFSPPPVEINIDAIRKLADQGDFSNAIGICEQFVARNRVNPLGHFYHALILEQVGRHEEAEEALRRAIRLDEDFVLGHYYLGLLCQRHAESDRAKTCFLRAEAILAVMDESKVFPDADGISVRELMSLVQAYLGKAAVSGN